jgi:ATP-binding cassette subfamily B protein
MSKLRKAKKRKEQERLDLTGLVKIYRFFGRHYKKYWKVLIVAYSCLFATIGLAVLSPWPLKLILDYIILKEPLPETLSFLNTLLTKNPKMLLFLFALSILVLEFLEAFFSYVNKFWVSSTGDRINADIRERVFGHLQRLSLSFHASARSGHLVYLLSSDVKKMRDTLIDLPQEVIHRVVTLGAYAVLMLALDWRLGLIALSTVPLFYVFTQRFGAGVRTAVKKRRKQEGEIASIIAENVTAMALVQAYGREETERDRFESESKESLEAQLRALQLRRTYGRITNFLVTLSTAGVLYFGGRYALGGDILPGTLVVFVAYLRDIYGPVAKFGGLILGLARSQVSGERLVEMLENDMIVADDPDAIPAPPLRGRVEFKNVSFAYKEGNDVLKKVSFVVEAGKTVALVGHSGAGKSTLISLLLRFYDPQQGQLLIDGQDCRKFTIESLRDQVTVVFQDAKLLGQTVRENIGFGKIGATEEEIVEAAKLAEAHDFIMQMPEGYETMIYEGGDNLSGGQKQRINIARGIIRNTPIVILDEPGTGLDAWVQANISDAIRRLTQDRTTFIIAHNFSTIAGAQKILLLEGGELIQQGSHEHLMHVSTQYRKLYESQFSRQGNLATPEGAAEVTKGQITTDLLQSSHEG